MNTYWKVDANISGANPSLGTAAVTSYTGITNGSLTLTNNSGTGNIAAQIGCSSTNSPSGTTCSSGDESVSVAFTPLGTFPQDVLACASFGWQGVTAASGNVTPAFQVVETATNAQTVIQEGKGRVSTAVATANLQLEFPFRQCGVFTFTSPGQKMLRLMYEQFVSGTVTSSLVIADANASIGSRDIHWEVYPLSYNTPAPILVGGVTSGNTTGGERVERVTVGVPSGCTVSSQSGSWISSTSGGASSCTLTIATGTFSSTPTCVCTTDPNTIASALCRLGTVSTTTVSYDIYNSTSGAGASEPVHLMCMGPR
jgi:hypothetical protein